MKVRVIPKHVMDDFPKMEGLFDVAPIRRTASVKQENKYNPQTANKSGEAQRRLRAEYRRNKASILRARNFNERQKNG